jgi:transposase
MVKVEVWADVRRLHRVEKLSIRAIGRRLGLARNTVREVLRSEGPPGYSRAPGPSNLDPFKGRIAELLKEYPRLSAVRVREILSSEGYSGGITILRDHVHQVRPRPIQAFQRTVYLPGEIGQVDPDPCAQDGLGGDARPDPGCIWENAAGLRVRHGPWLQPDADGGLFLPHTPG